MKIVADENMPYVEALFGHLGTIERVNGRSLAPEQLIDVDVLLVRSVTKVNQGLLSKANKLLFVGSATIGTDHIDLAYLKQRNIPFTNAPGCNATAVGEYAFIAMLELAKRFKQPIKNKVVGIVGAGNTGSALEKCLNAYGMKVLLCDPILEKSAADERQFVSLDTIIEQADIISLHVPITKEGADKTWYLFDEARLLQLRENTWLLNCCRGEVIDNRALIKVKRLRDDLKLVLDVWEGEPHPMAELVPLAEFATPHIAGYSLEGKARGTFMLFEKLCDILKLPHEKSVSSLLPSFFINQLSVAEQPTESQLLTLARQVYNLKDDDELFRKTFLNHNGFDHMRKNHTHRREFSALSLVNTGACKVNWVYKLGFSGVER
ncbi:MULTISPECIES: 4-phosphoerythronate dehydrogenase [unclassified Shewanella]|uniref:4-phosphoerythronate dehydrogenase n=1 Tax=unclassified Shewanella TaxID=196818 RepID=UPI000C867C35|nr:MULTISPECIES: 4-phosphoerythronate dehydrogenase [unclassified Shewanella]MDO6617737.1 4-phosphoerythronate dehydrogenase [Shewanella sp. 6_MG-2023]MDO6639096.1 4-phosphoerythronate dehydrogenase [Shewanella sp. 5_MG-2023]PMG42047.1 erythronate-4-phosphate dehydrogenase [Shewanella sp. 10N.286.52.B9]PMH87534.1 erythronate-4-phosphate dehydrogenase [Shewanella sp. 10N.286.48.B5]